MRLRALLWRTSLRLPFPYSGGKSTSRTFRLRLRAVQVEFTGQGGDDDDDDDLDDLSPGEDGEDDLDDDPDNF